MVRRREPRPPSDPAVTESVFSDLARIIREKGFKTPQEAQAYLNKVLKASGGKPAFPPPRTRTPLQQAQDLMYQAFDEPNRAKRLEMASEAFRISPDCADAHLMLATDGGGSQEEQIKLLEAAVQAGERGLGREYFEHRVGDFWGMVETRPYMRARFQLARCLWWVNRRDEAVAHAVDMLRLNPDDNQGVRYYLLGCYGILGDMARVNELLERRPYRNEVSAEWTYTRALVRFSQEGASAKAAKLLKEAIKWNRHVPAYLLGEKAIPGKMPEMLEMGEPSEAATYASQFGFMWRKVDGALDWLRLTAQGRRKRQA